MSDSEQHSDDKSRFVERQILNDLERIQSPDELDKIIGKISPAELGHTIKYRIYRGPGSSFSERVISLSQRRLQRELSQDRKPIVDLSIARAKKQNPLS